MSKEVKQVKDAYLSKGDEEASSSKEAKAEELVVEQRSETKREKPDDSLLLSKLQSDDNTGSGSSETRPQIADSDSCEKLNEAIKSRLGTSTDFLSNEAKRDDILIDLIRQIEEKQNNIPKDLREAAISILNSGTVSSAYLQEALKIVEKSGGSFKTEYNLSEVLDIFCRSWLKMYKDDEESVPTRKDTEQLTDKLREEIREWLSTFATADLSKQNDKSASSSKSRDSSTLAKRFVFDKMDLGGGAFPGLVRYSDRSDPTSTASTSLTSFPTTSTSTLPPPTTTLIPSTTPSHQNLINCIEIGFVLLIFAGIFEIFRRVREKCVKPKNDHTEEIEMVNAHLVQDAEGNHPMIVDSSENPMNTEVEEASPQNELVDRLSNGSTTLVNRTETSSEDVPSNESGEDEKLMRSATSHNDSEEAVVNKPNSLGE